MNVLLILSALKKGWEYTKGFVALALKYWYIVIIALLLAIATSLRNDVNKLNAEKDVLNSNMVALVQKQKTDLLEAQKKAQEKQIEILTKQKEVEVKYNEQIKALSNDVAVARNSANSLSKQLADNTVSCPQLPKQKLTLTTSPSQSYSKIAQENISIWQEKLTLKD
jgi:seryl-tRNA synthetase